MKQSNHPRPPHADENREDIANDVRKPTDNDAPDADAEWVSSDEVPESTGPLPRGGLLPDHGASTPPPPEPGRKRSRVWVWWVLLGVAAVVGIAGAVLNTIDMVGEPRTVVQATSHAIVVQPRDIIDLVQLARPRFGLHDQGNIFVGIRLEPPVHADTLFAALGFTLDHEGPLHAILIQRFEVTPACQISFEEMVDQHIRIDIRSLSSDTTDDPNLTCLISAELLIRPPNGPDSLAMRHADDARISPARPASMKFRPFEPLRLRRFEVTGIGFMTFESGAPESAIRSATISLPDFNVENEAVVLGDQLTLGRLEGELAELYVDDGIHILFKGKASAPAIDDRDLKPNLLQQGFYSHNLRIVVAIFLGFAGLLMAIFQVTLKDDDAP